MERKIMNDLVKWKDDILRRPLLLYGPKQIGKTYTTFEFATKHYQNVAYFNSRNNRELLSIFKKEKSIERIIKQLAILADVEISKTNTLIIIDDVISLDIVKGIKLFGSGKNDYHILIITSSREKLNVFKGEELQYRAMYLMDFEEYLTACKQQKLIDYIKKSFSTNRHLSFHSIALKFYQKYLISGGFPEAVLASISNQNISVINNIHNKIFDIYKSSLLEQKNLIDIQRGSEVFDSLPYQLLKDNKKFQYGIIGFGHRAKEYQNSIDFLTNNQLVNRCYRISEAKSPLSGCKDNNSFKLYFNDTGLLFTTMHLTYEKFLSNDAVRNILYENNIANYLASNELSLYYYQSEGKAEVSFVVQTRSGKIIPIELVDKRLAKAKSLGLFTKKYVVDKSIRICEDNFGYRKGIKYVPVYALFCLKSIL